MTAANPAEPDLHAGETSDAVLHLQTRLHALGYFTGSLDGYFGEDTGAAVAHLLEYAGLPAAVAVDAEVWAALAAAERVAPAADHQWQWDGESWQPNVEPAGAAPAAPAAPAPVDESGQWVWDGNQWQPVVG
jgi:peptidoglycan hydrolase-like protein with peptidoglycan-binding domain